MIEAGLVCHWSGLGPSPAWGAASRVSPNRAPLLPRTGRPIPTTPALRRNPRQRRSSALPRALLISLSEREMKAASPAPKVNVHNLSIMIGLPLSLRGHGNSHPPQTRLLPIAEIADEDIAAQPAKGERCPRGD